MENEERRKKRLKYNFRNKHCYRCRTNVERYYGKWRRAQVPMNIRAEANANIIANSSKYLNMPVITTKILTCVCLQNLH